MTEPLATRRARRGLPKHAAVILVAVGLDQQPGNPWGVADDIARALGLKHTPGKGPRRQQSGWARARARTATSTPSGRTS